MRSEYSISRYYVARRQVIDGYLTFDFKKTTSKCRGSGSRRARARLPPRSPRRGASLQPQRRGWQRGAGEASSGDPRSVCLLQCPDGRGCRGLQKPAVLSPVSNTGPLLSLPTPATRLRHTRALATPEARGRCAVVALRPRKLLAGEQALAGSPGRQCWPIFTLEGSWEPKACFPVVSWRITALDPTRRAPRAARRRARQDQRRERAGLPGPGAASPLCGRGRLNCPRLLPRSRAAAASGRRTSRG